MNKLLDDKNKMSFLPLSTIESIKYEKYEKINYKAAFIKVKQITKLHEKFNKVNQTCGSTGKTKKTYCKGVHNFEG